MTVQEIISQANNDARGLQEECSLEGRPFVLRDTNDWNSLARLEYLSDDAIHSVF